MKNRQERAVVAHAEVERAFAALWAEQRRNPEGREYEIRQSEYSAAVAASNEV